MLKFFCFVFTISIVSGIRKERVSAPVLMISFDGLRNDKLDEFILKNPQSAFKKFIDSGVRAEYMTPIFPSLTFPNHWTLVTGNILSQSIKCENFKIYLVFDFMTIEKFSGLNAESHGFSLIKF
jgi:hypothetical protein